MSVTCSLFPLLLLKPILHHPSISISSSGELFRSLAFPVLSLHLTYRLVVLLPNTSSYIPRLLLSYHPCILLHYIIILELQIFHSMLNISFYAEQSCYKNIKIFVPQNHTNVSKNKINQAITMWS